MPAYTRSRRPWALIGNFICMAMLPLRAAMAAVKNGASHLLRTTAFAPRALYTGTLLALRMDSSSPPPVEVGYVTDVEGNLDYFNRWVRQSRVLSYDANGELCLTHDRAYFVYGGDATDRGDGSLRLVRALVRLKQSAPSRVFLLVGNRDLNKLRFTSELSEDDLARPPAEIAPPHWDPHAPTLSQYLCDIADAKHREKDPATAKNAKDSVKGTHHAVDAGTATNSNDNANDNANDKVHTDPTDKGAQTAAAAAASVDCAAERLRYMYKHTLGCPNTFELWRSELALMSGRDRDAVTDAEVVSATLRSVQPGGDLHNYLMHADVAVRLGHTLFVHGAVDAKTMQFVPDDETAFCLPEKPQPGHFVPDVDDWTSALNSLLRRGLAAHAANPTWNAARTRRGGEVLLALQNRDAVSGRSIVSNCYCDGGVIDTAAAAATRAAAEKLPLANPKSFRNYCSNARDQKVAAWLKGAGVRRVVVGHKPSGDCAAVLSHKYTGVEVVSADTSYSDTRAPDGRGAAVSCVLFRGETLESTQTVLYGTLLEGTPYHARLPALGGENDGCGGDERIGRELKSGWWVKARTLYKEYACAPGADAGFGQYPDRGVGTEVGGSGEQGSSACVYLCCRGAGRKVERAWRSADEIDCEMNSEVAVRV